MRTVRQAWEPLQDRRRCLMIEGMGASIRDRCVPLGMGALCTRAVPVVSWSRGLKKHARWPGTYTHPLRAPNLVSVDCGDITFVGRTSLDVQLSLSCLKYL